MIKKKNFQQRFVSSIIFAPIILFILYLGGNYFFSLLILLALIMGLEWQNMVKKSGFTWYILGFFYIYVPCICLLKIREIDEYGYIITLWLLLSVWASDIGGYIIGTMVGGAKLCASISPSKTWSGVVGSVIFSCTVSIIFVAYQIKNPYFHYMSQAPLIALVGICGDLFESWLKRRFTIKDSSNLIPGHGGVLDRVDGIVTSALYVYLLIFGVNI